MTDREFEEERRKAIETFDMAWMVAHPEELDDELNDWFQESSLGVCLKHPLVFDIPYTPVMNARLNEALKVKRQLLTEAVGRGDWHQALWLHERPYRHDFLVTHMSMIPDDEAYWSLVQDLWIDTENPWQWGKDIEALFHAERDGREKWLMDDDDREALGELPETIKVYRGYNRGNEHGWSWTVDKGVAEWFARRLAHGDADPRVAHGKLDKSKVVALFLGRNEQEIVADPEDVRVYRTEKVKVKESA